MPPHEQQSDNTISSAKAPELEKQQRVLTAVGDGLVMLSPEGNKQYRSLQVMGFKQVSLWFLVGNVAGLAFAQGVVPFLPIQNLTKSTKKKYQRIAYFTSIFALSYHGYKLAHREFIRGKKLILTNPECILD